MAYATVSDLKDLGLPADALEDLTDPEILAQLDADAGVMDVYLGSQYTVPIALSPVPQALVRINVCLAVFHILLRRGFNPEGPDALYKEQFESCMQMLEDISRGKMSIPGVEDPSTPAGAPLLISTQPMRGWQQLNVNSIDLD